MTPYRFSFLRIVFGIYLFALFTLASIKSSVPEFTFIYWGLIGLSILFILGYQRQLIARSLFFFCYLLFIFEKSLFHFESVLAMGMMVYFAMIDGNEPWRIKTKESVPNENTLSVELSKFSTHLFSKIILFSAALVTTFFFQWIKPPNFNSWSIWFLLTLLILLIFPKFIFKQKTQIQPPILFFDGVCGLCSNVVDFVLAEDTGSVFKVAALQGETAKTKLSVDLRENLNTVVVLNHDGKIYIKSEALFIVFYELGGIWRLLFAFRVLPRPMTDIIYSLVAKYRYKIFGKKETCRLPRPDERSKFLS